jgi:hypothetical protein
MAWFTSGHMLVLGRAPTLDDVGGKRPTVAARPTARDLQRQGRRKERIMIIHKPVRALTAAFLLAVVIGSMPIGFAQARLQPQGLGMSTEHAPAQFVQAPIVRDHGQPTPAPTDHQPGREPTARLQLVIGKIVVHDDRDWGSGDISINVVVTSRDPACRGGGCITRLVETTLPQFRANSGDERRVDRVVPAAGDFMADASISPAFGISVYADREYAFAIRGVDKDAVIDDDLGVLVRRINAQNGWGPPGTYTARGSVSDNWTWTSWVEAFESGDTPGELIPAHFSVEYQIRRVPLPDLQPTSIKVVNQAGNTDEVCINVINGGALDAGPFQVALRLDGTTPPATIGTTIAARLASGQHSALCIHTNLPTSGQHDLTAVVDDQRRVVEDNETNNTVRQPYTASRVTTGDRPQTGPGSVQGATGTVGTAAPSPSRTATPAPTSSAADGPTGTRTPTGTVRAGAASTPTPTATRSASARPAGSRPMEGPTPGVIVR